MTTPSCAQERLVDQHFELRGGPAGERRLRAHLDSCEACRARYRRQLLLARLDPQAPSPQERLARGLGLASRRPARRWLALVTAAVGTAAAIALWPSPDKGFTARGGPAALPSMVVYRVDRAGASEPVGGVIGPTDELAFAYRNPKARKFLLVFGIDEHRHVYWYHPSWSDAAQDPEAVPIRPGDDLVELPEAIAHPLDGHTLTVHALLLDRPLRVREVEERVLRGEPVPGADDEALRLEVRR